jgi:hypothetical protein
MPPSPEIPGWVKDDLDEIKKFMHELPDKLDERFLRRETFAEFRGGLERRLDDIGTKVVDVGASTKRAWGEIDGIKASMVSRTTVRWVIGVCISAVAAAATLAAIFAR